MNLSTLKIYHVSYPVKKSLIFIYDHSAIIINLQTKAFSSSYFNYRKNVGTLCKSSLHNLQICYIACATDELVKVFHVVLSEYPVGSIIFEITLSHSCRILCSIQY